MFSFHSRADSAIAIRKSWGASLALALPLAAAVTFASAAPSEIPVGDFARTPQFIAPQLSPDGKHLVVAQVFEKDGRDTRYMVVYDLTTMKILSTIGMPIYDIPAGFTWVSNTRIAVSVAHEYGSLETPELTGEILSLDLDGRNQDYLYGSDMYKRSRRGITMADDEGYGEITYVPKDLNGHFLLTEHLWSRTAQKSRLYDVDATTAARRLVTEIGRPRFEFLMQNDGTPRFAYGVEESSNYAVYRFDDATRAWQELPSADKTSDLRPWALLPGDKELIASVSVHGGPREVVRQSLADGTRVVLAADKIGSLDMVESGPRPHVPFAFSTSVGIPKPRYVGEETPASALHKKLSAQFAGSYVHFINFADDGKLLFSVESDKEPGAFYLLDPVSGRANFLFAAMPWIEPEKMADQRPISFKSRDGHELHGYLTLPPNRADGAMPMVLLPHGGPHGIEDEWFFDRDAQFLASRGYAVLQVNYRGSGGRGPAFLTAGYHQWGGLIQNDLIDGVRWAVAQGIADEARICAYGGSFGAYSALMIASLEPKLLKCAVGYSGLYDLPLKYEEDATRRNKVLFNYWVKYFGQDPVELARFSPSQQASKITIPVLLVHGSRDLRTPPIQAETMRDALTKAGHPPEWMYVDGEGHGFYSVKNRQAFYERLEKFLAANLKK